MLVEEQSEGKADDVGPATHCDPLALKILAHCLDELQTAKRSAGIEQRIMLFQGEIYRED